ncbi:MAG: DNA polymerase I, partial [Clostridia bacterium]|nr:DNA polymerase I [Clostridia bacterium]
MKKLLAVDGNSIVNRAFYGVRPLSNKEGFPTNALFGMVGILEKNLEAVKPDFSAIAFDLKAPTFRHLMYDEYKAGRRPTPEDLIAQMPAAKEL